MLFVLMFVVRGGVTGLEVFGFTRLGGSRLGIWRCLGVLSVLGVRSHDGVRVVELRRRLVGMMGAD